MSWAARYVAFTQLWALILYLFLVQYVDDVLFDAPFVITAEFLATMNIHVVVKGADPAAPNDSENMNAVNNDDFDPYGVPRELGILRILDVGRKLTVFDIIDRIQNQRERYVAK